MKTIVLNIFFLLAIINSFAQNVNEIIYHNFVPDTSFQYICSDLTTSGSYPGCEEPLRFDIDSDGIIDLLYEADGGIFDAKTYLRSLNDNFAVTALGTNDTIICSELNWGSYAFSGHFTNDYRFGIKKVIGDNTFFGYVNTRVEFISTVYGPYNQVVYDMICFVDYYAFCTIPNYPLLWGQTDVNSVPGETANNKNLVLANNNNNKLSITANEQIVSIEIFNSHGEPVGCMPNVNSVTAEADISALTAGMYIVRAAFVNGGAATAKFVKQ